MIAKFESRNLFIMLNGNAGQKYLKGKNYAREINQST